MKKRTPSTDDNDRESLIETNNEIESESQHDGIDSIPVANVQSASSVTKLASAYMWLVALACLLIAIGLVWWSLPQQGIAIDIHFPEGHGLQAEDVVRFRGIDVGVVEEVRLNSDLTGVDVFVSLQPSAQALAREGTRFWVVRPELSLAGISGLETAVGHKYIGLIPGDPSAPFQRSFEGLVASPADAMTHAGIEIIIRGEKKYSVAAGSPVSCRGVEIGRILSVGLSQDARFVDVRARVFEKYTKLITTKTKCWATSGVDFDFSFGDGLTLDMESLETIARGGVSMLTVENGGQPIKPGHVFLLHQKPADGWYQSAALVSTTDVELVGVLPLELQWRHNGFLGQSNKQSTFNAVPIQDQSGNTFALLPADILRLPKKAEPGSLTLAPIGYDDEPISVTELPGNPLPPEKNDSAEDEAEAENETDQDVAADSESNPGSKNLAAGNPIIKLVIPARFSESWLKIQATRKPKSTEDCLAVRASGELRSLTYLHYPIERLDLTATDKLWVINSFDGDRDVWHGSPVLSATNGKLIGILLINKRQATIVPFDPTILN